MMVKSTIKQMITVVTVALCAFIYGAFLGTAATRKINCTTITHQTTETGWKQTKHKHECEIGE